MFEADRVRAGQVHWLAAVRGLVAIAAGVLAFVWPGISLVVLMYLFGAYAFINGILAIIVALDMRRVISTWWALLIEGLVGIAAGIATFFWPHLTLVVLFLLIAVWAVLLGIFEIITALASRAAPGARWMVAVAGAFSILFGVFLFLHPGIGILTIIWLIGFYAIAWGITLIAYAFQRHGSPVPPPSVEPKT